MDIAPERALEIIRTAFAPLECIAEVSDYNNRVRFRVFNDADTDILKAPDLTLHDVSTRKVLEDLIQQARSMVEETGHTLAPWTMPE